METTDELKTWGRKKSPLSGPLPGKALVNPNSSFHHTVVLGRNQKLPPHFVWYLVALYSKSCSHVKIRFLGTWFTHDRYCVLKKEANQTAVELVAMATRACSFNPVLFNASDGVKICCWLLHAGAEMHIVVQ
jgi:hypothetical protein